MTDGGGNTGGGNGGGGNPGNAAAGLVGLGCSGCALVIIVPITLVAIITFGAFVMSWFA